MKPNFKTELISLFNKYGSDFDAILEEKKGSGITLNDLYCGYTQVIDTYHDPSKPKANVIGNWVQVKEIYWKDNKYFFDAIFKSTHKTFTNLNMALPVNDENFAMLLKDYEYKLLGKLSILRRLYSDFKINKVTQNENKIKATNNKINEQLEINDAQKKIKIESVKEKETNLNKLEQIETKDNVKPDNVKLAEESENKPKDNSQDNIKLVEINQLPFAEFLNKKDISAGNSEKFDPSFYEEILKVSRSKRKVYK